MYVKSVKCCAIVIGIASKENGDPNYLCSMLRKIGWLAGSIDVCFFFLLHFRIIKCTNVIKVLL